jgi:hypothetical protein
MPGVEFQAASGEPLRRRENCPKQGTGEGGLARSA